MNTVNALERPTAAEALSYCERLGSTLSVVRGSGPGSLKVDARSLQGLGHHSLFVTRGVNPRWIPGCLLPFLEAHPPIWHVRVDAMVRSTGSSPKFLNALFARWIIVPTFNRKQWVIAAEQVAAADSQLAAFALPPTIVINGVVEIVALWKLQEPIDVSKAAGLAMARTLQGRLAAAIGASTAPMTDVSNVPETNWSGGAAPGIRTVHADDPEGSFPLCGIVRTMGVDAPPVITIPTVNLSNTYALAELERSIEECPAP